MRNVNTDNVTGTVGQPVKAGTIEHIQGALRDAIRSLLAGIFNINPNSGALNKVLQGMVNSGDPGGPHYVISAGFMVDSNFEVYACAGCDITVVDSAILVVQKAYFTDPKADPVLFTDGNSHNVHEIRSVAIVDGTGATDGFIGNYDDVDFLNP